jgi:hypothetical protein
MQRCSCALWRHTRHRTQSSTHISKWALSRTTAAIAAPGVVSRGLWRLTGHPMHSPDDLTVCRHSSTVVLTSRNIGNREFCDPSVFCVLYCQETTTGYYSRIQYNYAGSLRDGGGGRGGICRHQPGRALRDSERPHRNSRFSHNRLYDRITPL